MKLIMMAGASALALAAGPALAQDSGRNGSAAATEFPCPHFSMEESGLRSSDVKQAMRRDEGTGRDVRRSREGPARDAMGDAPVQPSPSARSNAAQADDAQSQDERSFEDLAELLPVPDVSDREVETRDRSGDRTARGEDMSAGETASRGTDGSGAEDFSDIIEEGERVPGDIRAWQDNEKWDRGAQEGQTSAREARRQLRDRSGTEADGGSGAQGQGRMSQGRSGDGADESSGSSADLTRQERRQALAMIALRSARYAVPSARFSTYEFEMDDQERVIEIAGRDTRTGRRVEVDVYPNGRIHSIDTTIQLDAVPESVRSVVRGELGRFRVAHTTLSLRRDLDVYYEFEGISQNGRSLQVEIRADGRDMSVRSLGNG